jgi:hypothetical protein
MQGRVLVAVQASALALALAACDWGAGLEGLGDPTKCGTLFDQRNCVGLAVESSAEAVLTGDTVRLVTLSDSGYSASVTWQVSESGAFVEESERDYTPTFYSPGRSILLRGIEPGNATITVTGGDGHHTATTVIPVVDSGAITRLDLRVVSLADPSTATTTMQVGETLLPSAVPMDSQGRRYAARPDSLRTADTTIATVVTWPASGTRPAQVRLVGRKSGSVYLVAYFLAVRDSVRITVH